MNSIVSILQLHKRELFDKYPIKSMALFGSYSRGEETENSDVDILVEVNGVMGFKFLHLNYDIEKILNKKVDLISKRGVNDAYMKEIEQELIYV
jgi:predicted nucleotidyltransferase